MCVFFPPQNLFQDYHSIFCCISISFRKTHRFSTLRNTCKPSDPHFYHRLLNVKYIHYKMAPNGRREKGEIFCLLRCSKWQTCGKWQQDYGNCNNVIMCTKRMRFIMRMLDLCAAIAANIILHITLSFAGFTYNNTWSHYAHSYTLYFLFGSNITIQFLINYRNIKLS